MIGLASLPTPSVAQPNQRLPQTEGVTVEEKLGGALPLDANFVDENGSAVSLGQFFRTGKPVVLNFAYHSCEVLCNLVLNATIDTLAKQTWEVGKEYEFVSISIAPTDTPAASLAKKKQAVAKYGRGNGEGWHFLTGTEDQIARAANAAGFGYKYDPHTKQYAHAAVVMLATPEGKLARYLYGIEFNPKDVKLGLIEASEGRSVSTVDQLLLYCYRFDATANSYVVFAKRFMKAGGALTMLGLGLMLFVLWRRDLRRGRSTSAGPGPASPTTTQSMVTP
jgi:protein SCO1/2